MAKSNAVWGIDIGQCSLKALRCTLESDGETIVADKYDYIEYPKILSQPEADPEELVRQALEQFLSRNDVIGDSIAISVPGQAGLSRFFRPPPVDAKTLPDIVKYEVKQQIPFPIEDVIWDWQQMGGTIVDGRTVDAEVGLFAMKRESVIRALQPFDEAGVEVDFIQLSPLSIFNVVCNDILEEMPNPEDFDPENPPESLVVMSMGTDTTDLIVSNGIKLWLRNIPIGGNHFTKILSREMKLTQAKAEHLKRNARQAEDPKSVFKAMRPVFTDLVNEVQRSLTFFQSMDKTAVITKIVLLGNAAKLPGLRQFLNKQLELDIAKVNEFDNLKGSDVVNQQSFKDNLLSFAPCYGLCLQGVKKGTVNTNLLPGEIVVERIVRAKKPWVLASVGIMMLGMLFGIYYKNSARIIVDPNTEKEGVKWSTALSAVTAQEAASKKFTLADALRKEKLGKLNRLAQELVSSSEDKTSWIEVQSAIYQALPRDPKIDELLAKDGTDAIDPTVYGFDDRQEIYIDHIETKYFKEIDEWVATVEDIYESMAEKDMEQLAAAKPDEEEEIFDPKAPQPEKEVSGPGYVIELKAHHFHNSIESLKNQDSSRIFVVKNLIKHFESKFLKFPGDDDNVTGGGEYLYQDFGIFYPTIVESNSVTDAAVRFKQKSLSAVSDDDSKAAGNNGDYQVKRYDFVVQMAWLPRSPRERFEAREKRLEAEAKAKEEADKKSDAAQQDN